MDHINWSVILLYFQNSFFKTGSSSWQPRNLCHTVWHCVHWKVGGCVYSFGWIWSGIFHTLKKGVKASKLSHSGHFETWKACSCHCKIDSGLKTALAMVIDYNIPHERFLHQLPFVFDRTGDYPGHLLNAFEKFATCHKCALKLVKAISRDLSN